MVEYHSPLNQSGLDQLGNRKCSMSAYDPKRVFDWTAVESSLHGIGDDVSGLAPHALWAERALKSLGEQRQKCFTNYSKRLRAVTEPKGHSVIGL